MVNLLDIPHMKMYKYKVELPIDSKYKTMYNVLFINNASFDSSIKFMKHDLFITRSKYLTYYMDYRYRMKIHNKMVNYNYKEIRKTNYEKIHDMFSLFKTPIDFEQINHNNLYFDLYKYNTLFFEYTKKLPILKRVKLYFNYILNVFNDIRFNEYKTKSIFMDLSDWVSYSTINNPISYMLIMYRKFFDEFKLLGDINFYIYTDDKILYINPSKCNKTHLSILKREIKKLNVIPINIENDEEFDKAIDTQEVKDMVSSNLSDKFSFTGDIDDGEEDNEEILEPIKDKIDDEIDDMSDEENLDEKKIQDELEKRLSEDKELIAYMHDTIKEKKTGKSSASLKRDEELRKKQRELKLNNVKLSDYMDRNSKIYDIPTNDISNKITSTNSNIKTVRFTNFEKSYNENLMKQDTVKIITALNNKSIPVYIKSIDVKDSSDELNYKETYHVVLEDENRIRHNLTFDVPKFVDDKFLYLNGSKKIINKQLFMKPIVKVNRDEVKISSNYNRIFIERYGTNITPKIEKFRKALSKDSSGITIKLGEALTANNDYKTFIEYDELSKTFISIKYGKKEFIFDQNLVHQKLRTKLTDNEICIGFYSDGTPIIMNFSDEKVEGEDFVDYLVNNLGDKFKTTYEDTKVNTKRYFYSRARIMKKAIPLVLLLGYCEGLTTVMKKGNIKHYFTDKRPTKLTDKERAIQFADGYLVYDVYPLENSILMNALELIPTKTFNYEEMDNKAIYLELFDIMFKARNLSNAFDTFYEFMIDPITEEVLEDLDYPTDFVSVLLCGNMLLADNSKNDETDMNIYRVRSNEIVNAIIHKNIAKAYSAYRMTAASKTPTKISIPKEAIIKEIMLTNTVEEFSTLNPIYESEKTRTISTKGVDGVNLENSYTLDKRAYNPTMMGIIGMSTPDGPEVGVNRRMTLEPNILGPRGYIDVANNDEEKLKDTNIFTAAELLTPMGNTHDESIRLAMASKQSGHIIPVSNASPVLISNGVEQSIQYYLSKDFIITAEEDGEIVEQDENTGITVIKYKSGKCQAFDTSPKVVKNSSSGFYISNKLNTKYKLGDKVKKNDIVAYEDKFFTEDFHNGNRFNIGSLEKIAIMSGYMTFEDSSFITNKMSKDLSTDIIMMKDVIIGRNANVDHIVKVGDSVHVGDLLVSFETSYEDNSINKFLASVGDELKEEIKSLGRVPIKSKYSGIIEDIRIYSSVDVEELSPSLQKIVKAYYSNINKKKKIVEKYDNTEGIIKAGMLFNETTGKIKPSADGKLKGREVFDGVLIEFYIKYRDRMGVGDKITFYSALKSVTCEVIPEGLEPYSEFRPEEEVSSFVGPSALIGRMTPSIIYTMFGNKILIELKRKLKEIYDK